jgi:Rieske Fe-S protein
MSSHPPRPSRRQVVVGCVAVCTAGTAGCTGDDGTPSPTVSRSGSGEAVARVADLPDGVPVPATGPAGQPIVVVRPKDADPVAYSAVCPHAGCTVAPSDDGRTLVCPCHGSTFDPVSGERLSGPATAPLSTFRVGLRGDSVVAL